MPQQKVTIAINAINKTEGHAGFLGQLEAGEMNKAKILVREGSRFIEGILIGRKYTEAPWITSRICGICPTVHNLTSIKALEKALRIKVNPQTESLRKLLILGQMIQSHITHIYFLALGDFFNIKSDLTLYKINPKIARIAIKLRDFGNLILKTIGGRDIHPTTPTVGGFRCLPTKKVLHNMQKEVDGQLETAQEFFDFLNNLTFPQFQRLTHFVSLDQPRHYALNDGKIKTSKQKKYTPRQFLKIATEIQEEEGDQIKKLYLQKSAYLVGALARLNLNYKKLNPEARRALGRSQIQLPCYNIFYNLLAQMIEVIHGIEEAGQILSTLKLDYPRWQNYTVKAGEGIGVSEAPRGLLFHHYTLDRKGIIRQCNIITPTAQFLANLELDLRGYLKEHTNLKKQKENIKMLIRAYDPCITCAVH